MREPTLFCFPLGRFGASPSRPPSCPSFSALLTQIAPSFLRSHRPVGEETTEALFYLAKFVEKVSSASSARISTREDDSTWLRCGS